MRGFNWVAPKSHSLPVLQSCAAHRNAQRAGVEPGHQRLGRRICKECKEPYEATPALLADIFLGKVTKWGDARIAAAQRGNSSSRCAIVAMAAATSSCAFRSTRCPACTAEPALRANSTAPENAGGPTPEEVGPLMDLRWC